MLTTSTPTPTAATRETRRLHRESYPVTGLLSSGYTFKPWNHGVTQTPARAVEIAHQMLTMGYSMTFVRNPWTGQIVKIMKKGQVTQRVAKELIARGFQEWFTFSAFCPDTFIIDDMLVKLYDTITV